MKNFRKNALKSRKGITLIALVITIIVLLILAGISISMLSGENSILQKATEAKQTTERSEAKEQARMDIIAWITDKNANHQNASLDDAKVKEILSDNKSYVKEAKDSSFITKKGEYEIPYSELYIASDSTPTIKYGLQEDGVTFITEPGEGLYPTDNKTYYPWVYNSTGWQRFGEGEQSEFQIFIDNWTFYSYDIHGKAFDYCGPKTAD